MKYLDYEIRQMEENDLDQVMEIENLCFPAPWKKEDYLYEMHENPFSLPFVIELSNKQLNLCQVCGYIDFWITFDSATLTKIAVHPDIQREHLASMMMDELINICYARKVRYITLEVRVSNVKALGLYKKYGFKIEGVKAGYYKDGEDAYYMVREVELNG